MEGGSLGHAPAPAPPCISSQMLWKEWEANRSEDKHPLAGHSRGPAGSLPGTGARRPASDEHAGLAAGMRPSLERDMISGYTQR